MAVYFKKFNAAGMARVYSIGLGSDALTEVIAQSANLRTVGGGRVLGDRNSSVLVVYNPATNTAAEIPVPLGLQCEGRSASDTAYYLVCVRTTVAGTDVGLVAFDLGTMQFSPFVVVKSRVGAISFTSNATYTPAGILFGLYEGGASRGTRTAYRIDPGTMAVSAGVAVPGVSDDLDEQVAIGGKVYLTMYPANQVVPVDVATLAAGGPIAVAKPRHIVAGGAAGGGALFVVTNAGTDDALAKVDPASGAMALRTFPPLEASKIDSMAFSPP